VTIFCDLKNSRRLVSREMTRHDAGSLFRAVFAQHRRTGCISSMKRLRPIHSARTVEATCPQSTPEALCAYFFAIYMFGSRNWGATGIFNTGLFFSQFFLDRFCFLIDFDKKKFDAPNIHLIVHIAKNKRKVLRVLTALSVSCVCTSCKIL